MRTPFTEGFEFGRHILEYGQFTNYERLEEITENYHQYDWQDFCEGILEGMS